MVLRESEAEDESSELLLMQDSVSVSVERIQGVDPGPAYYVYVTLPMNE